ncbi:MAG: secretin N-terminal domain-containing protein [Burkholderiaceae bacterium]
MINKLKAGTLVPLAAVLLSSCAADPMRPSDYHLLDRATATMDSTDPSRAIPDPVRSPMTPPPPREGPALETYSVVVNQVEISELLFAMARDAKINVDVHPSIRGRVTVNAIEQTLPQILNRLSRQVSLRYEFDGQNLVVMPDSPFVRHYSVDYVNISRDAQANTSIATQISSTGKSGVGESGGTEGNNNSTTQITNRSQNRFWDTLESNLRKLLETADAGTAPASAAASGGAPDSEAPATPKKIEVATNNIAQGDHKAVIVNRETSMITVRGNNRDHERVREYIDKVMNSARRQVLIEATIAEVQLSDSFQQGVNWQKLRLDGSGWSFLQQPGGTDPLPTGAAVGSGPGGINFSGVPGAGNLPGGANNNGSGTPSLGVMRYLRSGSSGDIGFALSLLQSFGKVKVLSSPKISVLNNQTAVLKVVDNRVYFTIDVQVTPGTDTSAPLVTYTSKPNTVPVGFVMSVTPQIEDTGAVTMNVRPTISRIIGFVNDPNPALAQNNIVSRVPEIQTREIESILKVISGDVAVMGGLMQESVDDRTDALPGPANLPLVGELFRYRNDTAKKSELVIFLRPVVIKDASLDGDYKQFKSLQPKEDFFTKPAGLPVPRAWRRDVDAAAPAPPAAPTAQAAERPSANGIPAPVREESR